MLAKHQKMLNFHNSTKLLGNIELHNKVALNKCIYFFMGFAVFSLTPFWYTVAPGIAMKGASCWWDIYQIEVKELTYVLYVLTICSIVNILGTKSLKFYSYMSH